MRNKVNKIAVVLLVASFCVGGLSEFGYAESARRTFKPDPNKHIPVSVKKTAWAPVAQSLDKIEKPKTTSTYVSEKIFDADGNLIGLREEFITKDLSGRITKRRIVTTGADGKKTVRTLEYSYTLDDNGNVSAAVVTCKNGKGDLLWTAEHAYTIDEAGKKTERKATFIDGNGKVFRTAAQKYSYNDRGKLESSTVERTVGKGKNRVTQKAAISFTYDENGKRATRTENTISSNGRKRESVTTYKNGIAVSGITKTYKRNNDGTYSLLKTLKSRYL